MTVTRLLAALVLVTLFTLSAPAQNKTLNNELAGTLGRTFIADQGVPSTGETLHSGNGFSFGVNYARHLAGNGTFLQISLEVPFVFNPDEDLNYLFNEIPGSYSSFFLTPSARLNLFANTAVSPWFSAGGGFGHFSAGDTLEFGGPNPGPTGKTTGVFQFGTGLDVRVWHTIGLRGELRDFYSGVPPVNIDTGKSRQHNLYLGGGLVWHF